MRTIQHGIPIASNDNRVNSQGRAPISAKNRTSMFITNIIQAGKTLPLPATGTSFYVTAATGAIEIRPSGGVFNSYDSGTGLELDPVNAFEMLEVRNNTANAIVFQIFVGFDGFIDKRLVLQMGSLKDVAFPTYDTPSSGASVLIDDLSGQGFTDINGNEWYALYRKAILIFNTDSGTTLLLQERASIVSNGPAIAAIYPLTSVNIPVSGNYKITLGGANVNCIVSEVYASIPQTI